MAPKHRSYEANIYLSTVSSDKRKLFIWCIQIVRKVIPWNRHVITLILSALQINIALILRQLRFHKKKLEAICQLMLAAGNNNDVLATRIGKAKRDRTRTPRRFWVRPGRTQLWWKNFLNYVVVDEEWKENFRMTKRTFMKLCEELSPYIRKKRLG